MIEQVKFTFSPLGQVFEKQIETIEGQGEKQIKATEDHGKQLVVSNEIIKKDFNIDRNSVLLEEQKNVLNELVEKRSSEFMNLEKEINSDNLIRKYKTKGIRLKDFSNYQNVIELFKDLRDGNKNPKEVLIDQMNFKSDLDRIKIGKSKIKIKRSNTCNTKCGKIFLI